MRFNEIHLSFSRVEKHCELRNRFKATLIALTKKKLVDVQVSIAINNKVIECHLPCYNPILDNAINMNQHKNQSSNS